MYYSYIATGLIIIISFIASREKTLKAVKVAIGKFKKIFPTFITMLLLVSIILFLFPDEVISSYLNNISIVFTYIGAAAICRVPMTLYEASFMGVKFTVIRLLVSLPLVIITSILLGNYLSKRNYKMVEGK